MSVQRRLFLLVLLGISVPHPETILYATSSNFEGSNVSNNDETDNLPTAEIDEVRIDVFRDNKKREIQVFRFKVRCSSQQTCTFRFWLGSGHKYSAPTKIKTEADTFDFRGWLSFTIPQNCPDGLELVTTVSRTDNDEQIELLRYLPTRWRKTILNLPAPLLDTEVKCTSTIQQAN